MEQLLSSLEVRLSKSKFAYHYKLFLAAPATVFSDIFPLKLKYFLAIIFPWNWNISIISTYFMVYQILW